MDRRRYSRCAYTCTPDEYFAQHHAWWHLKMHLRTCNCKHRLGLQVLQNRSLETSHPTIKSCSSRMPCGLNTHTDTRNCSRRIVNTVHRTFLSIVDAGAVPCVVRQRQQVDQVREDAASGPKGQSEGRGSIASQSPNASHHVARSGMSKKDDAITMF